MLSLGILGLVTIILVIILIVLTVMGVLAIALGGAVGILAFSDIIVCMFIVVMLIKLIHKKKRK